MDNYLSHRLGERLVFFPEAGTRRSGTGGGWTPGPRGQRWLR